MNLSKENVERAIEMAEKTGDYDEVILLATDASGKKWVEIEDAYCDHDDSDRNLKMRAKRMKSLNRTNELLWQFVNKNVPERKFPELPKNRSVNVDPDDPDYKLYFIWLKRWRERVEVARQNHFHTRG